METQKTILLAGGSGFLGTKLAEHLIARKYKVLIVDIFPTPLEHPDLSFQKVNLAEEHLPSHYDGQVIAVINLAGKNIFGRWTKSLKEDIYNSRIKSTQNIVSSIISWNKKPEVFISASAFGYYGDKGEEVVTEESKAGSDFLARVCVDWEKEANWANKYGIRTVVIRTGLVLGQGGLLAPLFLPFRTGFGAWIGAGRAWFPWVHIDDIINIYSFALLNSPVSGPINACAPEIVRQKDFMKIFGEMLHRKVLFSIPAFILWLWYGDLAYTFDNSAKMSPEKIVKLGFPFRFPNLRGALGEILKRK